MGYKENRKDPQKKLTVGILKEMLEGINPNTEVQVRFGRYLMRIGEKIGVYEKGDTKIVYLFPIEKKQNNEEPPQSEIS